MIKFVDSVVNQNSSHLVVDLGLDSHRCTIEYVLSCPVTMVFPGRINVKSIEELNTVLERLFRNTGYSFSYIVYSEYWCLFGRSPFSSSPLFFFQSNSAIYTSFSYLELARHCNIDISELNIQILTTGMSSVPFVNVQVCNRGEAIIVERSESRNVISRIKMESGCSIKKTDYNRIKIDLERVLSSTFESGFSSSQQIGVFASGGFDSAMIAGVLAKLGYRITLIHWHFPEFPCTKEEDYFYALASHLDAKAVSIPITLRAYTDYFLKANDFSFAPFNHMSLPWWGHALQEVEYLDIDCFVSGRGAEGMYINSGPVMDHYNIKSFKILLELLETRTPIKDIVFNRCSERSESYNNFLIKDFNEDPAFEFKFSERMEVDNQDLSFKEIFYRKYGLSLYNPLESEVIQDHIFSVPNIYKTGARNGVLINKRIYRDAFRDLLPNKVLARQQQPYLDILPKNAVYYYGDDFRDVILNCSRLNSFMPLSCLDLCQKAMNKAYNSTIATLATARWLDGYLS